MGTALFYTPARIFTYTDYMAALIIDENTLWVPLENSKGSFNHIHLDTINGKPRLLVMNLLQTSDNHVDKASQVAEFIMDDMNSLSTLVTQAKEILKHYEP